MWFYTKLYNHFRTIGSNSLTPITYETKISNNVGTQGSIQFICWPIALHSNILSLAKSLIGSGTVRLAPILLPLISETSCFLGLLLMCRIRIQLDLSLFNNLTNLRSHGTHLTLSPGFIQKTHFSITFKTMLVYFVWKQVELALVHRELCEIHSFHKDAKMCWPIKQNSKMHFQWKLFSKTIHIL